MKKQTIRNDNKTPKKRTKTQEKLFKSKGNVMATAKQATTTKKSKNHGHTDRTVAANTEFYTQEQEIFAHIVHGEKNSKTQTETNAHCDDEQQGH